MSSVTLACKVNPPPSVFVTYQWKTGECYANDNDDSTCFPNGQTTPTVRKNNLLAKDAGTITCTATVLGVDYTSNNFTLRISGMVKSFVLFVDLYGN